MKAHELLNSRDRWTTRQGARDFKGNPVGVIDERATCWCMLGAIAKCHGAAMHDKVRVVKGVLRDRNIDVCPAKFNDTHTYEEVLEVLKEADV